MQDLQIEHSNMSEPPVTVPPDPGKPHREHSILVTAAEKENGYAFLTLTNTNHDGGDYFLKVQGDGTHVLLDSPKLYGTNPLPVDTISVESGADLQIRNWPNHLTFSVVKTALNNVAVQKLGGKIDSPDY